MVIKEAIAKVVERTDLSEHEAVSVMREIMEGAATPAQIASYMTALRMKGETIDEITGSARVMREKATRIQVDDPNVVDTCGTGGDGACTFNISTTVAFVVAGAGVTVAKHGNRSVSSACGSADVLQALGVEVNLAPPLVQDCINRIGIGFLFAPHFHAAMKYAASPRQEVGIRGIFNMLGPLTNPAGAKIQLLGVFSSRLPKVFAHVLLNLGSQRCLVVHGADGLDELTITGKSSVAEGRKWGEEKEITPYTLQPQDFGCPVALLSALQGGDATKNADILISILNGERGPRRDVVLVNAAAALFVAGRAQTLQEGVALSAESIDSGRAKEKLDRLRETSCAIA